MRIFINSFTFLLFFLSLICCSLFSIGITKNHHESIARKMGNNTYVCEVISNQSDDNLRKVFDYADDAAGAEIKSTTSTFVLSEKSKTYVPAKFDSVEVDSVFQHTTWSLDKYNYGFQTLSGSPIKAITANEIYINTKLAEELASKLNCSEQSLINKQIDVTFSEKESKVTIKDVITNLDDLNLGPYFSGKTIIAYYPALSRSFHNTKYVAVLKGGFLSKTYSIKYIENTIDKLNSEKVIYSSKYYKLINNKLFDDGIQQLCENTSTFFTNQHRSLIPFVVVPAFMFIYIGLMTFFRLLRRRIVFVLIACTFLYLLISSFFLPLLVIKNTIYLIANSMSSVIVLYAIVFSILIYFLFERSNNKAEGEENKLC